jgi:uncharacterized protein with GYD domain
VPVIGGKPACRPDGDPTRPNGLLPREEDDMRFIVLFNLKAGVNQGKVSELMSRRADYKFPEGVELISEYWTPSDPAVVSIVEAADSTALMANSINWVDAFDTQVLPAIEYQEGLKKLPKALGRK